MKATVAELKKKVRALADQAGYRLDKKNPFFVNNGCIKAIENYIVFVEQDGDNNPDKRLSVTPKQRESLNQWVRGMKDTYLYN